MKAVKLLDLNSCDFGFGFFLKFALIRFALAIAIAFAVVTASFFYADVESYNKLFAHGKVLKFEFDFVATELRVFVVTVHAKAVRDES